ncbi:hypothetical protein VE03_01955 [Pseudogymnoascus sp. 23342-1-I1]|nr:hypothetical protein VE03_01955 [Pseudogymnoascus sp. 23342-1-I1]
MENRTYLWLHLTFDIIEKSPSEYSRAPDIETLLSSLPSQVSDAYEKILSRSKNQSWTKIILQIILAATRPLTLGEANVALALAVRKNEPKSHTELESELLLGDKFQSVVINLCGLFVSVYDSKLSFIHQTAREFLMDSKPAGTWNGIFNTAQSHSPLSKSCIFYLLLPDIDGPMEDSSYTQYPFLDYAANNWPLHFVSQNAANATLRRQARTLCNTAGHQVDTWAPYYFKGTNPRWKYWSDLALASRLGLHEVVEDILFEEKPDIQNPSSDFGKERDDFDNCLSPLVSAATQGHKSVVELLLENGAKIEAGDNDFLRTPLSRAAEEGHEAVVRLLLKKEANKEAQDIYGMALLSRAVGRGHVNIVQLLLQEGADIETENIDGHTPLLLAAQEGKESVVRLLLKKNANKEAQDIYGMAPLLLAVVGGHENIIELLLKEGANIKTQDGNGQTALLAAARRGREDIVEVLLENGADIEAEDHTGQTPLSLATSMGNEDLIKLLLDRGK